MPLAQCCEFSTDGFERSSRRLWSTVGPCNACNSKSFHFCDRSGWVLSQQARERGPRCSQSSFVFVMGGRWKRWQAEAHCQWWSTEADRWRTLEATKDPLTRQTLAMTWQSLRQDECCRCRTNISNPLYGTGCSAALEKAREKKIQSTSNGLVKPRKIHSSRILGYLSCLYSS